MPYKGTRSTKSSDDKKRRDEIRRERQMELLKLIESGQYRSQKEVTEALQKRPGGDSMGISQPTVSRDLEKLPIEKDELGYYRVSREAEEQRKIEEVKKLLGEAGSRTVPVTPAVIVACRPGYERLIAERVSGTYREEVAGALVDRGLVLIYAVGESESEFLSKEVGELLESSETEESATAQDDDGVEQEGDETFYGDTEMGNGPESNDDDDRSGQDT